MLLSPKIGEPSREGNLVGSVEGVHGESAVMEQHAKLRPISGETAIMINWNCWVDVLQLVVRGGFFFFDSLSRKCFRIFEPPSERGKHDPLFNNNIF